MTNNNLNNGIIKTSLETSRFILGNQGRTIINSTGTPGGYIMLAKLPSTNGVFCIGSYKQAFAVYYTNNETIAAETNTVTYTLRLLDESSNTNFPGNVYFKVGTDYTEYRGRNIAANTSDITAGSTKLSNGNIYLVYE